ncbi:MAG: polysaccharide deacetylase family protein, partial [Clostridia bacterium]|nr:polysaccharide deacetylase family protein [Clostridia bacterium]
MKVLPAETQRKPSRRKRIEILSSLAIILTILALTFVTGMTYRYNGETERASSFAIYKGDTERKEAALMFNVYEGAENIIKILDILRKYSAKATFFIGGIWAEKNTDTLLKIVLAGQELGSHGYLHKDHAKLSIEQNKEEIAISSRLVEKVTGQPVTLFAPPSGSFGENTETACKALGMKMILWSKDTIDWRDDDVDLLVKRATKNISEGDMI